MWRCLVFVVAVILWNQPALAVPQGENTCQGVVKHPVKVFVNVTEPVTFRTYTWCLRVPPRCSKYIVQMRERVKEQVEMHNRTITVCCRGFVEMESKCVPACPPMTECPNMHCNRTNHCYCSPGYSGIFCNDPCPKGSWGRDCKKPCDCPDGFTCHHLTGDCMLDDKPSAKTTARHSRFTHETVGNNSPYTTTLGSPSIKILLGHTTPATLSNIISTPASSATHSLKHFTTVPKVIKVYENKFHSTEAPFSPSIKDTLTSYEKSFVDSPEKTTLKPNYVFTASPFDKETKTNLKISEESPLYISHSPELSVKSKNSFSNKAANEVPRVTPIIATMSTHNDLILQKSTQTHRSLLLQKPDKKTQDSSNTNSFYSTGTYTSLESHDNSVSLTTKSAVNISTPISFDLWNVYKKENKGVQLNPLLTTTEESASTKSSIHVTINNFNKNNYETVTPIYSESSKSHILATPKHVGIDSPHIKSPGDSLVFKSVATDLPVKVYTQLKPQFSNTFPNSHNDLILSTTEQNFDERYTETMTADVKSNIPLLKTRDEKNLDLSFGTNPFIVSSSHSPILKSNQNYHLVNSDDNSELLKKYKNLIVTSSTLPSVQKWKNKIVPKTFSGVDTDKGIFVFPPRISERIPNYDEPTIESSKEVFTSTSTPLYDIFIASKNTLLEKEKINYVPKNHISHPLPTFVTATDMINLEMKPTNSNTKVDQGVNMSNPTFVSTLQYTTSPGDKYSKSRNIYTKNLFVSPKSLNFLENGKLTSPFNKLYTMVPSSKKVEQYQDSNKQKPNTYSNLHLQPELSTKQTVEQSKIGTFLNVLNKNDFIAIFRPESEYKSGVMPFTVLDKGNYKTSGANTVTPSTLFDIKGKDAYRDRVSNYITSTYSFSKKTDISTFNNPTTSRKPNIDGLHYGISRNMDSVTSKASLTEASKIKDIKETTLFPPFDYLNEKNRTHNGKILHELSNFLPSIHENKSYTLEDKMQEKFLTTSTFTTSQAPHSGYLPTNKDFLNLTYLLNSINDFNLNGKTDLKHSSKSVTYVNPPKIKLTVKPSINRLTSYSGYRTVPTLEKENVKLVTQAQKLYKDLYFSTTDNRENNFLNDSRIIHINISSHLSFQNPTAKTVYHTSAKSLPTSLNPSTHGSVDGKITTVSITSANPYSKFPMKRSTKEINSFKTENAFTLNHHNQFLERNKLEISTRIYDPLKNTNAESGEHSSQKSITEGMELMKKPFRRKESSEKLEGEVRPNMTAALSAHTASIEVEPRLNLSTGIISAGICLILLGSLTSFFILKYFYNKRGKPVVKESCIMAYESSNDLPPISCIKNEGLQL